MLRKFECTYVSQNSGTEVKVNIEQDFSEGHDLKSQIKTFFLTRIAPLNTLISFREIKTLYTIISKEIGQWKIEEADVQIKRMQNQIPGSVWEKDYSEFMNVMDESDDEIVNPCPLMFGYCWVVRIK